MLTHDAHPIFVLSYFKLASICMVQSISTIYKHDGESLKSPFIKLEWPKLFVEFEYLVWHEIICSNYFLNNKQKKYQSKA